MWALVILGLLAGATASRPRPASNDPPVWLPGRVYQYSLEGKTLNGMHQVNDKFVGLLWKGNLTVQRRNDSSIFVKITSLEYAEVDHDIPGGWSSSINLEEFHFSQFPMVLKHFELGMNNTAVNNLTADRNAPTWERNIGKAIATALNIDTMGTHAIDGEPNPFSEYAAFTNLESGVFGKCNVGYIINPTPKFIAVRQSRLGETKFWQDGTSLLDVSKRVNYTYCTKRPVTNINLGPQGSISTLKNVYGTAFSFSTDSHAMLSGGANFFRVLSARFSTFLEFNPLHYSQQKGMSGSELYIRLENIEQTSVPPPEVDNPITSPDLVYEFPQGEELRLPGAKYGPLPDDSSSSSDSDDESGSDSDGSSSSNDSESSNESSESNESEDSESSEEQSVKPGKAGKGGKSGRRSRRGVNYSNPDNFRHVSDSDDSSSSDSSSGIGSSSEEAERHLLPKTKMNEPLVLPFNRVFLGRRGLPLTARDDVAVDEAIVQILREIGSDMICTGEITIRNVNEKVVQVTEYLRLLNATRMLKIVEKLRPGHSSPLEANNTWTAFVYAAAQSGAKPALVVFAELIRKGILEPELQAPALGLLARNVLRPDPVYTDTFWNLLQTSQVRENTPAYTTGMLAFGDMLYSILQIQDVVGSLENVYGRLVERKDKYIADKYVEKLEELLETSLQKNSSHEVQLYIRTIGNTGSDKVAEVFDPYFNGEKNSTSFQRQAMVMALEKLGTRNRTAAVDRLYGIIESRGEDSTVRSLGCFMFMKSRPSLAKMAKMAQSLRQEKDKQVISACATALLAASKLQGAEYEQLAKNAQAATKVMATNATGIQRSSEYWINHVLPDLDLEYEAKILIEGSRDTILPKGLHVRAGTHEGGFRSPLGKVSASTTSISDLLETLSEQIIEYDDVHAQSRKQLHRSGPIAFTLDDITKHFKVRTDIKEALRAVLFADFLGTPSLITYDKKTISYFAEALKDLAKNASKDGLDFNWSKFVISKQVLFGTPNAMGLPTSTSLVNPVIVTINGNVTATTTPDIAKVSPKNKVIVPDTIKAKVKATIAVSTMARGDASVVFPFKDSTVYNTGYKSKTLVNLPIEVTIYVDLKHGFTSIKIEPLQDNDKQRVLHLSQVPYVYTQKVSDFSQPQLNVVHKRQPTIWSKTYGKETTGLAFQVDSVSELIPDGRKLLSSLIHTNLLQTILVPLAEREIGLRNISVYYDPQQSSTNSAVIRTYYDESRNEEEESSYRRSHPRNLKRGQPGSGDRSDLLSDALSGIEGGEGQLLNMTVEFEGRKSALYSVAVAIADSRVDTTNRFLAKFEWKNVTATKVNKALLNITAELPLVPVMSLNNVNPNGTATIWFNTTTGMEIGARMNIQRTLARQQYIANSPLTQLCQGQMEKGNNVQYACRNTTVRKYFLNNYDLTGSYSNINPPFANATYKLYQYFVQKYYPLSTVNVVNATGKPGRFAAWATISPERTSGNISIVISDRLNANITNIRLSRFAGAVLMTHSRFSTKEIALSMLTRNQYNATCAVDRSLVNTFDNSTYSMRIGDCWTTVLLTARRRNANGTVPTSGNPEEVAVLIRSTGDKSREVKVLTSEDEIILKRSSTGSQLEMVVNGQKTVVRKGEYKKVNGRDQTLLVRAYGENDSGRVEISGMILNFDGERLLVQADDSYRDSIRGLCGTFDGNRKTDLKVPRNCILGNETAFVQEYVFPKGCKAPAPVPMNNLCVKEIIRVGNDTSESEIVTRAQPLPGTRGKNVNNGNDDDDDDDDDSDSDSDSDDVSATSDRYTEYRTLVRKFGGKKCFSVRPQRSCNKKSKPQSLTEESVVFHCVTSSSAADVWEAKANRGEVLDFLLKKKGHSTHTVSLPKSCKPLH